MLTETEVDRLFKQGFDRSQIVLGAVSERLGMTKEQAYAVASCFGIGMAQGGMCGAALGAIMALGLRYGNTESGDLMTKSQVFDKRDEFLRRFAEMNGKTSCPELLDGELTPSMKSWCSAPWICSENARDTVSMPSGYWRT